MTAATLKRLALRRALWALLMGNFVIGTGVMVVPGTLNDLSQSLAVSVTQAGLLITAGAVLMGIGAPLFAGVVAGWDRRRLLSASLAWYGLGLLACAIAADYTTLLPLRVLTMVSPAVFTPQAAASVGLMVKPEQRGQAVTFVFLGWSVASVLGMPLSAWVGGWLGWRWAFAGVGILALMSATWVWWVISYFSPYFKQVLGADANALSLLFLWFVAFGLIGNMLMSRHIDRLGADRAVALTLGLIALSLLLWFLVSSWWSAALVLVLSAVGLSALATHRQRISDDI
jgi:predicted MFS family arabinose efflux permease